MVMGASSFELSLMDDRRAGTLQPGDSVGVEIFGELVAAEVADEVQYDPGNERVRS